ncbi:hypothetical protein LSTR_LSTR014269 [Laodelphax striatellus]|uniref:Uncharacterized protein n=1 Tax=Laodelphax striatellus TaxID=195883 RepID=A0A482XF17_LAOST|nr:hypothetical protein LSTR_LSTR014269 [Laodelphax striatellus]
MTSLSHAHAQTESKVDFKVKATWVAHIKGGLHLATQLAATHDFTLVEKENCFVKLFISVETLSSADVHAIYDHLWHLR